MKISLVLVLFGLSMMAMMAMAFPRDHNDEWEEREDDAPVEALQVEANHPYEMHQGKGVFAAPFIADVYEYQAYNRGSSDWGKRATAAHLPSHYNKFTTGTLEEMKAECNAINNNNVPHNNCGAVICWEGSFGVKGDCGQLDCAHTCRAVRGEDDSGQMTMKLRPATKHRTYIYSMMYNQKDKPNTQVYPKMPCSGTMTGPGCECFVQKKRQPLKVLC